MRFIQNFIVRNYKYLLFKDYLKKFYMNEF